VVRNCERMLAFAGDLDFRHENNMELIVYKYDFLRIPQELQVKNK